jgi:hypothetical protein
VLLGLLMNSPCSRTIILPGDPEFDLTLATSIPPDWKYASSIDPDGFGFAAAPGSGIFRPLTSADLEDYLYGGEYEERMNEIGGLTEEWDG